MKLFKDMDLKEKIKDFSKYTKEEQEMLDDARADDLFGTVRIKHDGRRP